MTPMAARTHTKAWSFADILSALSALIFLDSSSPVSAWATRRYLTGMDNISCKSGNQMTNSKSPIRLTLSGRNGIFRRLKE